MKRLFYKQAILGKATTTKEDIPLVYSVQVISIDCVINRDLGEYMYNFISSTLYEKTIL